MTVDEITAKMADVQERFEAEQAKITEANQELIRLQGEYRAWEKMLPVAPAPDIQPSPDVATTEAA